jgi:G3E family GTPase
VKSFVFRADKAFDAGRLEDFLGSIVQVYGPKMLRYKGVLHMKGADRKVIFQGVHQLMGSDLGRSGRPARRSRASSSSSASTCRRTSSSRAAAVPGLTNSAV